MKKINKHSHTPRSIWNFNFNEKENGTKKTQLKYEKTYMENAEEKELNFCTEGGA